MSCAFVPFVCSAEMEEDPGLLIMFETDQAIHNCLGLATAATVMASDYGYTINPPPPPGTKYF